MSNDAEKALDMLASYRRTIRECEVNIAAEVAVARANGASWEAIGEALGISRQAAHKGYGPGASVWV